MEFDSIMILVVGLLAGIAIGYLVARLQAKPMDDQTPQLKMELQLEQERTSKLTQELAQLNNELRKERENFFNLNGDFSSLRAHYKNLQEKLQEQKQEVKALQDQFAAQFKNLANEIFEEKSKKFTDQNKNNIDQLLKPLGEKLKDFERKVEQSNKDSLEQSTALKAQLDHLKELNQRITKEAESLTKALKGDSKAQGNWGEMQLELILEKVGLQKETHYFKEKNYKSEDGNNQRLDYIIKLPDDKYLVLDSKVSLTAYSNYYDAADEAEQSKYLRQHLDSIRTHIKILGDKNYQNLYDIQQPDFVLMFVANEPALTMALKEDTSLFEKALDKNIVLVSTSTLLATMRTVSYIWKQDNQNKNALEIARQAGALYDKFANFTEDLLKVGQNIKQTQGAYQDAMKKLSEGNGNLVRRTENLRALGAKTFKQIDQRLVDRSETENDASLPPSSDNLFG
ncbi:DNA recombination protein RmuC [Marinoscillum pacificum]|uniref:DNA recombination protein RmuC n=1 Tax=Marinoscillum pacificum TaxID=392723 RepID=UPI00215813CF|nr:DNA recombination protein RmuC [Marinoscillum pacificum]